jgi:DNA-binding Lrp family transcriptional regulator
MDVKYEVLKILANDALASEKQIAAMLNIEEADAAAAIAQLKEDGILVKYSIVVNTEAMGEAAPAEAMIEIKVEPKADYGYEDIARRIYQFPHVKALYLMSGRYDLSIRVEAKTVKDISQFVWEQLSVLEGVRSTETLFIMRKYKENGVLLKGESGENRLVVSP